MELPSPIKAQLAKVTEGIQGFGAQAGRLQPAAILGENTRQAIESLGLGLGLEAPTPTPASFEGRFPKTGGTPEQRPAAPPASSV
jgi:hypothetical protein